MTTTSPVNPDQQNQWQQQQQYILQEGVERMTPKEKLQYKIDLEIQTELLDRFYTKIRQKIREKGAMITHDAAKKLVLQNSGLQKIMEEMFNAHMDEFAKEDPVLAAKLRSKDPKDREEGMRVLNTTLEELDSCD